MRLRAMPLRLFATTAIATAVLAPPRTGAAQQARPTPLDSATEAAIAPILARAQAANLPVELLIAKAREGRVKRVPVTGIQAAVRALAERIHTANEALAPNATEPEVRAAVDALAEGVSVETLRAMRKAGRNGSLAVPIGVLTQLVARGVPVEKASVQIVDLLQRGAVPRHFIALDDRVREDVLAGRRPDESLDLRLKGIFPTLPASATADGAGLQATPPGKRPR